MVSARSNISMLSSSAACCNDAPRITHSPPRYKSKRCSIRTALRLGATHGPGPRWALYHASQPTHLGLENEQTAALAPRRPCRMAKVKAESMPSCGARRAASRARSPAHCRSSCRRSSNWCSTSRPPRRSALPCRSRCSPAPAARVSSGGFFCETFCEQNVLYGRPGCHTIQECLQIRIGADVDRKEVCPVHDHERVGIRHREVLAREIRLTRKHAVQLREASGKLGLRDFLCALGGFFMP